MDEGFATVPDDERERAIETLIVAFSADPVMRWLYPKDGPYRTHFGELVPAFGGRAFTEQTAWELDDLPAVALWLPPDVGPDGDAVMAMFDASVSSDKIGDVREVLDQMDQAHPTIRHWYLAFIGVDSARQGQGLGTELMNQCLEIVDKDHLPAYLDSTNPRNVAFYERHGFKVTGESQAGACPPIASMLRDAQ
jgi:ribosomal protein S18 acetylase RimI-like enzyme